MAQCSAPHTYTVEVIGQVPRYDGTDPTAALSALASIGTDSGEEGYVVATHTGPVTSYCPRESNRLETEAIVAAGWPAPAAGCCARD